ncbi:hypothetical protein N9W89_05540 [Hellea sp.]|nr:hypothetical protein [Hellea sp.]
MRLFKQILPAAILSAIFFLGGEADIFVAQAQASTPVSDSAPARDVSTPSEDMALTNSCMDNGKEKVYCLCVTKIYKHKMTLRQYRGAVALYQDRASAEDKLYSEGYSQDDIRSISAFKKDLSSEAKFRMRCDRAEIYFAAASQD